MACRLIKLGGFGVHNLETLGWGSRNALVAMHPCAKSIFAISITFMVGNGYNTKF
jgi:hypothetical protein